MAQKAKKPSALQSGQTLQTQTDDQYVVGTQPKTVKKASANKTAKTKKKEASKSDPKNNDAAEAKTDARRDKQYLVVVESPTKAKTIEKFLGNDYSVIASNGHIRDLPKSQLGVDVEHNFAPKYITIRGRGEIVDKIRKDARSAARVFLATDPDREGEAISWHISEILSMPDKIKRITFNEITKDAIKKSIKQAREIDQALVNAQQARRILDRLVGYKLSPILWQKVRKGLSAGRVQSVATLIICDREQEINSFVEREFWTIAVLLTDMNGNHPFEAKLFDKAGKKLLEFNNRQEADETIEQLNKAACIVSKVKPGEKSVHAAAPFTTSNLQQEAVRKLNFTTKRTMLVAQQLYEGIAIPGEGTFGLITYMRTDSVRIASEAQHAALSYIREQYGESYAPGKPNFYKGRKNAQDAHEAIRPTYLKLSPERIKAHLTSEQYKLYRLIYNRFLESQMTSAEYDTLDMEITAGENLLKAHWETLRFPGFMIVSNENKADEKGKGDHIPPLKENDGCIVKEITPSQHFTQPPPRYTEATLVKALEEKGVGRPSTYAPIISTIIERGYVARKTRLLYPTDLGNIVTQLMKENFSRVIDIDFTAKMEADLDDIEENNGDWVKILSDFYNPFIKSVEEASATLEHVKIPDVVSDVPCDKCGAMMVYKEGRFGKFLACPNYPACKNTKTVNEPTGVACPKCGGDIIKKRSKKGNAFYGCSNYPNCDFVVWDRPLNEKCPKCNSLMVLKSGARKYKACSNPDCSKKQGSKAGKQEEKA
ncbi:MAG: type I DNA topoisomerase [Christensenellales bacterium]